MNGFVVHSSNREIINVVLTKAYNIRDRLTEAKSWDEFHDIMKSIRSIVDNNDNDYQDIWLYII